MVEERTQRRLAAILAADVVGYGRLMEADEAATLTALRTHRALVIDPAIAAHRGRIVKLMGDGMLAEFASVVDAVECAIEIQRAIGERNADVLQEQRLELRIGVNLGDVVLEGGDVYGEGVNMAARLEGLAQAGSVCISGAVHDAVGGKLASLFESMGEQQVKNIAKPVRAYRLVAARPRYRASPDAARRPTAPTLAVKPFESAGGNSDQESIAAGLTNGILTALTRVPGLVLVGDESPSLAISRQMTVEELGRRFAVTQVLKGGLRRCGDKMRVDVALVDLPTGQYLWAEKFDRNLRDIVESFALQDEIIEEIVTALDIKLLHGEAARLVRRTLNNQAALECSYRGEMLLWIATTKLEIHEAQRLLEETIRLEPTASLGYAEAALAHWVEAVSGLGDAPSRSLERAMELAREAVRLNDVTGYPHLVMAHVHLNRREFDQAMDEADAAVLARPSCSTAYSLKASVLNYLGRPEEAVEFAQYAVRLTPVYPPFYPAVLAGAYHGAQRHEEAVLAAKAALDVDARRVDPYLVLAASNAALDRSEEAHQAAAKVLELRPSFTLADYATTQPYKEPRHLERLLDQLRTAGLK